MKKILTGLLTFLLATTVFGASIYNQTQYDIGFVATGTTKITLPTTGSVLGSNNNLSELSSPLTARSNLGLVIGTNVQAWNSFLDQIAAGTWTGASSITTLGTISTGVWNGTPIANNKLANSSVTLTSGTNISVTGSPISLGGTATINVAAPFAATTLTSNGLLQGNGSSNISAIAPVNNAVVSTNGSGVPSESTTLPSGLTIPGYALSSDLANYLPLAGGTMSGDINTPNLLNFTQPTLITGTITQSGTLVTFSSAGISSNFNGGWLTPSPGTSERVYYTGSGSTMRASLSQTISAGTNYTLSYSASGGIDQAVPAAINIFPNSRVVTFGSGSVGTIQEDNFLGSGFFVNGLIVGDGRSIRTTGGNPTASQSTVTVTGSGANFAVGDIGRTIAFNGGQNCFITAFTDATHVTCAQSQTVAAQQYIISGGSGSSLGATSMDSQGDFGTENAYIHNSLNLPNGTFSVGGNTAFSGGFTFTGTVTGNTAITFPTSGTLATTAQIPTGAALTKTDGTNVTLTLGGAASTALLNAASIAVGWTGTLASSLGGSGVASPTAHGILVAEGASAYTPLTLINGQILVGSTGADPVAANITGNNGISVTNGAGTIALGITAASIANASLANSSVTLTAGNGISITGSPVSLGGAATITLGNMNINTWSTITGTSQTMASGNGYTANNASLVTFALPAACTVGDVLQVNGEGAGGWKISQAAGQQILLPTGLNTTIGTSGFLSSASATDNAQLRCIVANTTWSVESISGIPTYN